MNFKSDVRRQLLSDRVRETISITYGLGKVMQEFADVSVGTFISYLISFESLTFSLPRST